MPTAATQKSSTTKAPATKAAASAGLLDAVRLLTSDHREVKGLFQDYQALVDHDASGKKKQPIAELICKLLTVHATIEEEIFYPAAKRKIKDADLIDEATVEHASAKDLIAQIESSDPSDDLFDAKVKVLGEYIDHHVKEEESELFPQVRKAGLDLQALGEQLTIRKSELMAEVGLLDEGEVP
jgi:hemerythrin superfamily protein